MKTVDGGVCAPKGFRASGVAAGIKEGSEDKDCALIVSDELCTVAGMFTTNIMKSPPVYANIEVCRGGHAQVVFINSGNANAAPSRSLRSTAGRAPNRGPRSTGASPR